MNFWHFDLIISDCTTFNATTGLQSTLYSLSSQHWGFKGELYLIWFAWLELQYLCTSHLMTEDQKGTVQTMCFWWVFHFANNKMLNNVLRLYPAGRLCVKSVFLENPAPLSSSKKCTAAFWHKDNILCNAVQCAHLRSTTLPQAKETTRFYVFDRAERRLNTL